MVQEFINYLNACVGDAYVWGGQGEDIFSKPDYWGWIKKREKYVKKNYDRVIDFVKKSTKYPIYAFDCSGLITNYLLDIKVIKHDRSANGLYHLCLPFCRGRLKNILLVPGTLLFRQGTGRKVHVGVYVADGTVIHAKGRDEGVVKEPITKSRWTHYGYLPYDLWRNK